MSYCQRSLLAVAALVLSPAAAAQITLVETFPLDFLLSVVSGPDTTDVTPDLPGQITDLVVEGAGTMTSRIEGVAWWNPVADYNSYSILDLSFSTTGIGFGSAPKTLNDVPIGTPLAFDHTVSHALGGGGAWDLGTDGTVTLDRPAWVDDLIWVTGEQSFGGTYTVYDVQFVGDLTVTWQPDPLPFTLQCSGSSTAEPYGDRERFYLHAQGTPPDVWSMWVMSDLPGSSGPFCLGAPLVRVKPSLQKTTTAGETTYFFEDLQPMVGQTLYFQLWHRLPGGTGTDVSDGIAVTFS